MPRYIVTAWKKSTELLELRAKLYRLDEFRDNDCRREGVRQILAWKLRHRDLPLAIESTSLIVEATLHDDERKNSLLSIRMGYAQAIGSFVSWFCDSAQRSTRKLSMHDAAVDFEIPAAFVELRHECVHRDLPPAARLRRAAEECLSWLWAWYWSKLDALVPARPAGERDAVAEGLARSARLELRRVLKAYLSSRRAEIKLGAVESKAAPVASKHVEGLSNSAAAKCDVLSAHLIDEKLLIPSERIMGSSMAGAFLLWDAFLKSETSLAPRFLPVFIMRMVTSLVSVAEHNVAADPVREAEYLWAQHIICDDEWSDERAHVESLPWDKILETCVLYQNIWGKRLSFCILESTREDVGKRWRHIIEAAFPTNNDQADSQKENGDGIHAKGDIVMKDKHLSTVDDPNFNPNSDTFQSATEEKLFPRGWTKWRGQWKRRYIGESSMAGDDMIGNHNTVS